MRRPGNQPDVFLMTCQKKKKEEPGWKFKCNYSGHGKIVSQVFDDKNLVSAEAVVCFISHL